MTAPRMPASVSVSLALHAGGLALFLGAAKTTPEQAAAVVEGVDLLIAAPKPQPAVEAPKPLSTMDFLKLALPSRAPSQQAMTIKLPETRKPIEVAAPKLDERTRKELQNLPKLQDLDMSMARQLDAAKLEAKTMDRRSAATALAAMPRLEEVGRRQVKDLPQALVLEESRQKAVAAVGIAPIGTVAPTTRRQAVVAMAALSEATPPPSAGAPARGLAAMLPESRLDMGRPAPVAAKLAPIAEAPKPARVASAAAEAGAKKGVDIEGPLADRKVRAYVVPPFPQWARDQGILEATVAIRFNVDAAGDVMQDMRVERTSGYGRLDKLAMEALKGWKFAPMAGAGVQWGIITFRFVLE